MTPGLAACARLGTEQIPKAHLSLVVHQGLKA